MAGSEFLRAAAIILAALLFRSVIAVVIGAAIVAAARLWFLLSYTAFRKVKDAPPASWASLRTQLGYALRFWVSVVLQIGLRNGHTYYVMAVLSSRGFAIYAIGIFQLPIVQHMVDSVAEVMIVRASEAYRAGDFETLRRVWTRATVRLGVLLIPVWVGAQCFAVDVFRVLFGPQYVPAVPIFRIFVTFFLLRVILDHGILRATGDTKFIVRANAAALLTMLIALPFLTRWHVMMGAVTAFVLGVAVARFAGLYKVCKRIDLTVLDALQWRKLLGAAALAIMAGAVAVLSTRWLGSPAARLASGGPLFLLGYGFLIYGFGPVPRSEIRQLAARFKRRS